MPNSSRVCFLPQQFREGLDLKTSTPTDSGGGSEQWVVMSGDLTVPSAKAQVSNSFGVQICGQVTVIDTKKKSSTTQGGGKRDFTIYELRLVVKVVIFNLEKELEMNRESCRRRGWQHRALQLRGQLLQRGGVGGAGQHCGDFQGSRCWVDSWVPGCEHRRPSTPGFRGVPVLPASSRLPLQGGVLFSFSQLQQVRALIHTTQWL